MISFPLPSELEQNVQGARLVAALHACTSAGAAILALRGEPIVMQDTGEQLKTSVDQAAEGWILGFLKSSFPTDRFLAEESYDLGGSWSGGTEPYWTVDALDGTRSYIEGYDGFCVQVAYVCNAQPCVGVVFEPAARKAFVGIMGAGAWAVTGDGSSRLTIPPLPKGPKAYRRFVDSAHPRGEVGELFAKHQGTFVECGSVGLKLCRVAEGRADVFAKKFRFKLWDVAPGTVILREAGGTIGTWDTPLIDYSSENIVHGTLLATHASTWHEVRRTLGVPPST